jgi:hypothetical protein
MLQRKSPSAPKPASAKHDSIVERALESINPKPERAEEAREEVAAAIALITHAEDMSPATTQEISALRATIAALQRPWAECLGSNELPRLRDELEWIVEYAEWQRSRKGPRRNPKKLMAAFDARCLLHKYGGVEPKMTDGSAFYELAAVLYEAATGVAGADLSRACKGVERRFRFYEAVTAIMASDHSRPVFSSWRRGWPILNR